MEEEKVHEFKSGKDGWNTFEVLVKDGHIKVRDETGMIEFDDDDVDELIRGIDEARRELREQERMPTAQ